MFDITKDGLEVTGFKFDDKVLVLDCDEAFVFDKELNKNISVETTNVVIPKEVILRWIDDYGLIDELDINLW